MQNKKTLVILSPAFPENEAATYWVPSQQLMVKALKRNFPGVHIIVLALLYPYHTSNYTWHDAEVISFDGTHKRKLKKIGLWRNAMKTLKKIHTENNLIGILSFWCGECAFIGNRFAKKYTIPHYIWVCGQDARKTNRWIPFIRPEAGQLLAMSDFLVKEFYKNHGIKPQYVVPNAVDPDTFPSYFPERDIDILGTGSFEPLKQYEIFTEVIQSILPTLKNLKAFHCGIGREQQKIESLIKQFGLENNFSLLGGKKHEEVIQLMQRSKIFLHTSNYEGFSTVCLEALYAGAHVVSFCYPLNNPVQHWYVVKTKAEMIEKVLAILCDTHTAYTPVLLHTMDDSARMVMQFFQNEKEVYQNKPVLINQ